MSEKFQFYFKDLNQTETGIINLKLLNLKFHKSFQTTKDKTLLKSMINEMMFFKFEADMKRILDYSELIDQEFLQQIFNKERASENNNEYHSSFFIFISENSFNDSNLNTQKLLKNITLGKRNNLYVFLIDSSKTYLEFNNERIAFTPLDAILSKDFTVDPITALLDNKSIKTNFTFVVPAKELWTLPNSPIGIVLFPFVIPIWSIYNFLKVKLTPISIGSIIQHRNDPSKVYGVAFKDNQYLYICKIKHEENSSLIYTYDGPIMGKIPIKNNNFIALNYMET